MELADDDRCHVVGCPNCGPYWWFSGKLYCDQHREILKNEWMNHLAIIRVQLDHWTPASPFAWWDDALCHYPWHYDFHCRWVSAWNSSNRQQPAVEFVKQWIEILGK